VCACARAALLWPPQLTAAPPQPSGMDWNRLTFNFSPVFPFACPSSQANLQTWKRSDWDRTLAARWGGAAAVGPVQSKISVFVYPMESSF